MIPLKLEIKNFLSYGPEKQTIDFGPYPLICLSGKNGHGKSALLDALTWAIWGQARKTSGTAKADEGLLRLGQTQMMVCLDFSCNYQVYRVRREFALTYGKPYAALDFGILNPDTGYVQSLTDKTIRATQDKIELMIGLDFDAFVNSAFLRQGQSNEFSKKSPKDRKEILASILGLNRFEALRKAALDKSKAAQDARAALQSMQDRIRTELASTESITASLMTIQTSLTACLEQEVGHRTQLMHIEQEKTKLTEREHASENLTFQINEKNKQEIELLNKFRATRSAWKSAHRLLLTMHQVPELELEKKNLQQEAMTLQARAHQQLQLREQYLKEKERERLCSQYEQTSTEMRKLQHEQEEQQTILKQREQLEKQLILTEAQFEKRKTYYHRYIAQGNVLSSELAGIAQKQQLSLDDDNPSCPLCEQNLSASRKKFLRQKFTKSDQSLQHRLGRFSNLIAQLKAVLIEQHEAITQSKRKIADCSIAQAKHDDLGKRTTQLAEIKNELEKAISISSEKLSPHNSNSSVDIKILLAALEKQIQELAVDPARLQQIALRLSELEAQLSVYQQQAEIRALQYQRAQTIHELAISIKEIRKERTSLEKQQKPFMDVEQQRKEMIIKDHEITESLQQCLRQKERLLQEKGSFENQKQKLLQWEQELAEHTKKIDAYGQTSEDYQTIASALGKDGIQALLIEEAIPEIEQEANHLLAKLTDNQAHILIESLRDLKKGGTKETLDIKISDPLGIRPYELFSGGEAFRIDFAIRIAISKLLARRAGTALQTLIIDEGFGSQDEDGLNHIMDAIHKIQEDFSKVIIVSHLATMKDQFPVHFVIDKGAQGSRIQVVEQG